MPPSQPPTPPSLFRGMANSALNMRARYEFKYASLHGVYGTPAVFVGGVYAASLSSGDATLQDWHSVLKRLLGASGHLGAVADLWM